MSWLGPALAAALATTAWPLGTPGAPAVPATASDEAGDIDVIQAQNERFDRMTVPVKIDDSGPYAFMIDTGAEATVVSLDLADRLGLAERSPATLVAMASRKPIETAFIPHLELGSRSFNIQTAPLVDRSNIGAADGVLGLDSLQNQRVLIDFAEQRIAVADARDLGGNRGYEIVVTARRRLGQLIITSARFDNVRVAVIVDTGAEASIGNDALMRRLRGGNAGPAQITDINGVQASGTVRLASEVRIGDAKLSNIPVAFVESPLFKQLGLEGQPAMVLGMNELRLFRRVAIDFKQGKVLFDLPPQATLPQDVFRVMPF
ncbi:MAG TPA: retroviral-like aspartic protease family protein [Sphingomonadaceae bacterium]